MKVLLHVCLYTTCVLYLQSLKPQEALSHYVGARNQTWVLWKSSQCS